MFLSSSLALLIFCLVVLSVSKKEVLKSPTIIVDFSVSLVQALYRFRGRGQNEESQLKP